MVCFVCVEHGAYTHADARTISEALLQRMGIALPQCFVNEPGREGLNSVVLYGCCRTYSSSLSDQRSVHGFDSARMSVRRTNTVDSIRQRREAGGPEAGTARSGLLV